MAGKATRGNTITYGEYGLVATEPCWIKSNQIEAARIALTRYTKRTGKVWIKIFPDKPVTAKPAETRMGSGKGTLEYWVAVVKPGRVYVRNRGAFPRNPQKKHYVLLCISFHVNVKLFLKQIWKAVYQMKTKQYVEDLKKKSDADLAQELVNAKKELFNLRFQNATNQLDNTARIKEVRKNIARIQTLITEKAKAAQ